MHIKQTLALFQGDPQEGYQKAAAELAEYILRLERALTAIADNMESGDFSLILHDEKGDKDVTAENIANIRRIVQ